MRLVHLSNASYRVVAELAVVRCVELGFELLSVCQFGVQVFFDFHILFGFSGFRGFLGGSIFALERLG